jgi:hypothetical protein
VSSDQIFSFQLGRQALMSKTKGLKIAKVWGLNKLCILSFSLSLLPNFRVEGAG